jgi:hypothetical protein
VGRRAIGPAGTATRVAVGGGLLVLAGVGPWAVSRWEALLGLVGVPAALVGAQALRARATGTPMFAAGCGHPALGLAVAAGVGLWLASPSAFLLFFGSSMVLAAARGTAGCEVLTVGNWVLRRDDMLVCPIFSPIDRLEAGLTGERPPG